MDMTDTSVVMVVVAAALAVVSNNPRHVGKMILTISFMKNTAMNLSYATI